MGPGVEVSVVVRFVFFVLPFLCGLAALLRVWVRVVEENGWVGMWLSRVWIEIRDDHSHATTPTDDHIIL